MHSLHQSVLSELNLYDFANDAIFVLDANGDILDINTTACDRLGYSKQEMLGKPISKFNSKKSGDNIPERLAALNLNEKAEFEATHVHKNGNLIPCEVNARIVQLDGQSYIIAVARDITERKKIEEIRKSKTRIYITLLYINRALLESQTEIEVYNRICQIAVEYGEVKLAWVGKLDKKTQYIEPIVKFGKAQTYLDGIKISVSADQLEGHGPTAIAYREQRTEVIRDFSTAPLTLPWHERAEKYGLNSSVALSIMRGEESYAVITFYYEYKNNFDQESIDLLEEMSRNISLALDRFD